MSQLVRRMPEQGRIRLGRQVGTRNGKTRPDKLEHLRFTSKDKTAIEQIAQLYGGSAQVWDGAPGARQWEVITEVAEIPVILPPDCLGGTPIYEEWNRGGVVRRCDGEHCEVESDTAEGSELGLGPCLCAKESGPRRCKLKTRLTVILAAVRFGGGWRLETGSEYAARELPGMVSMIEAVQAQGLVAGILRLDQRQVVRKGKTSKFAVPVLALGESMDAMREAVTPLEHRTQQALPLGNAGDVDEAEVIDVMDDEMIATIEEVAQDVADLWNGEHPEGPVSAQQLTQILAAQLTNRPNQQIRTLDRDQGARVLNLLADVMSGQILITSIQNGRVGVKRTDDDSTPVRG